MDECQVESVAFLNLRFDFIFLYSLIDFHCQNMSIFFACLMRIFSSFISLLVEDFHLDFSQQQRFSATANQLLENLKRRGATPTSVRY